MEQLCLFQETEINDIKNRVYAEFPRLPNEPFEEWREFIRIEIDYRLAQRPHKKPKYDLYSLKTAEDFEAILKEFSSARLSLQRIKARENILY